MGLTAMFESKKRNMKTSGASILLNDLKHLVSEFTVAELSDLLTQAVGSPI
jgi:hypothetical protein